MTSDALCPAPARALRFERCELRPDERRLLIDGRPAALGGRAFDVLRVLLEQRHRPVHKTELLDAVWPGQDVEEGNLQVHISALRKLLGAHTIITVPGCGYRFALPLTDDPALPPPAPAAAPPAADTTLPRTNLPRHLPPLIGRDAVLASLTEALAQHPVLSIVGPGGMGKTRLAQALAFQCQAPGVWWVDVAELCSADEIVHRLGQTLGLALNRHPQPLQALVKGLRRQQLLLVLDNCEHLVAEAAALVQQLREQAPGVRWLITSQEPLKTPEEQVYRLEPLAVPPPGATLAQALDCGAVALLQARARAADRRFALTEATLPSAIDLCAQLDGIALAIEMAAARLPLLGLDGVCSRLDERLRLLGSDTHRNVPSRHRTLFAALDWSHNLLSPAEQAAFRQLAVFRGGFSLELAQAVLTRLPGVSPWDALDRLGTLVDKSLVQVEPGAAAPSTHPSTHPSAPPRYRLLESTRLYAQAQAEAAGELQANCRAHGHAVAELAQQALDSVWQQPDRDWLPRYAPEIHNLRAALAWAVQAADPASASVIHQLLLVLNNMQSSPTEARRWVADMLTLADIASPTDRARLLLNVASSYRNQSPAQAAQYYQQAAEGYRALGDAMGLIRSLAGQAISLARLGDSAVADALLPDIRALVQPHWPARLRAVAEEAAGLLALFGHRPEEALYHHQQLRLELLEAGADSGLAAASINLAAIALAMGRVDEAIRIGREHCQRLRLHRNTYLLGCALGNLFAALVRAGQLDEAQATAREALPMLRDEECAVLLFDHLALLAARQGQAAQAAALIGHGDAARHASGSVREADDIAAREQALACIDSLLDPAQRVSWMAYGAQLSPAQADVLAFTPPDTTGLLPGFHSHPSQGESARAELLPR